MAISDNERHRRYRVRSPLKAAECQRRFKIKHRIRLRAIGRERERIRREEAKANLLHAAGGACLTCGFSDIRALHIDHINDDGRLEERRFRLNTVKYQRHVLENLGTRYQILCANCNHIKEWERRRRARLPHTSNLQAPLFGNENAFRPEAGL